MEFNMPFVKGQEKKGGRKKGTPNKIKLLSVEEILARENVNPIEELIKIARTTEKEDTKVTCWKEISKYTYSQKKAVESEVAVDIQPEGFLIARA